MSLRGVKRRSNLLVLFLVSLSPLTATALLSDEENNIEIYKKANPAVVNITTVTLHRDFFLNIVPSGGMGSGAIISPKGYILTNDHVVGRAQKVEVTLSDKRTFPARVVGRDPDTDLAVIKILVKEDLPYLEWGNSKSLAVGQKVLAIGNPFGFGGSLSVGIISSLGRDIRAPTDRLVKDVIQTDAAINPGNSGGPLLDSQGRLVGINTQIVSKSGGSEGIGFAISVHTAEKISGQLIRYGRVIRPELGLSGVGLPAGILQALKIPSNYGVMITEFSRRSAARKAGLLAARKEFVYGFRRIPVDGDVIFRIDDTPVETLRDIQDYIFQKRVGATVTVHYFRGKQKRSAKIRLPGPPGMRDKSL